MKLLITPVEGEDLERFHLFFLVMFYSTELFYFDHNFETVGESVVTGIDVITHSQLPLPHVMITFWAKFHMDKRPTRYGEYGCQNSIHCDGCRMVRRREARHRHKSRCR